MSKLKPCPFCGGEPQIKSKTMDGHVNMFVQCKNCFASSQIVAYKEAFVPKRMSGEAKDAFEKPLLNLWNRRYETEGDCDDPESN